MTSKINLKTLFTMPMAPPPNKLSLQAKQFDGKTKERQCCARFYGGYCSLWPNRTARSLSRAWPSLLRAHNHIGGATAVPLHHKKCLLCSVLIYIVLGDVIHGSEYGNWSLLYFVAIFISLWGFPMTLLTAGALTDPQLPAAASKVCTTDAWLGGVGRVPPPNKNPS